ncbi:DUF4145 domain-containing protein [Herbaspirillum sp.]|jgi:hypothetical protein|uniref:DUF4145 domain-containing protein n=1 Tax=Herbaspirillum TaxID=963 RepID=UPI002583CC79|nr:DUF4145 domain-containing protein [Herbaspirillum sp.]
MIIECTHCRQYVEAQEIGSYSRYFDGKAPSRLYTLLSCLTCREPILVAQANVGNIAEGDKWDTPFIVFPQGDLRVNPRSPPEIQSAFEEACACYRTQAYTASAIMCRKTLEGICAVHGVEERNLSASLRKLKELALIDDQLFEWSDALRVVGNEAAHGVGIVVSQADAKDAIEFTNAILDYLFSYKDRFEQFMRRRKPEA